MSRQMEQLHFGAEEERTPGGNSAVMERQDNGQVYCDCRIPMVYLNRNQFDARLNEDPLLRRFSGLYQCAQRRCLCSFFE